MSPVVVAIPARNEADQIGPCLRALAGQRDGALDAAVICLNNCHDDTAGVIREIAPTLPFRVQMLDVTLPATYAGLARRLAMDHAAEFATPAGVLLGTDADARVPPDWVTANRAAIAVGADAVAGRAIIEPEGAKLIPARLHAIDARESAYAALLDEIGAILDPDPADPWPRHDEESGASIGVTVAAYRRAGGIPLVQLAEDRAFFAALRRVDARIRHAPEIGVVVSARTEGRAKGGMADTMRRRIRRPDPHLDARLEPAAQALRRLLLRRAARAAWSGDVGFGAGRCLASRLGLSDTQLATLLNARHFGTAWAALEAAAGALRRRVPVPLESLPIQAARAARLRDRFRRAADRTCTAFPIAAE